MDYFKLRSLRNNFLGFQTVAETFVDLDYRYQAATEEVANLQTQVQNLIENCENGGGGGGLGRATGIQTFAEFALNTVIRPEYLRYIQRYGVPEDGVFKPTLLATVS